MWKYLPTFELSLAMIITRQTWTVNCLMARMKAIGKIKKATSTGKGKIIALSILVIILSAIVGGIWYWNTHKKAIIRDQLESAIRKKSKGLYIISYGELSLDEINGNLSVENLSIAYDSNKYISLKENIPPTLFKIRVPQIIVSGVKTPRALIDQEIVGRTVKIINPEIELFYTYAGKDSSRNTPSKEVYEQILGNLNLIRMDTVLLSGAKISTASLKTGIKNIELTNAAIQLEDVSIDSASSQDNTRLLFAKQLSVSCGRFNWKSHKQPYSYTVDSVYLNSGFKNVYVKGFHIDPLMGEDAFVKSLPTQDDRFDFAIDDITIAGIDMQALLQESIIADSVLIGSASFKIYRDLSIIRDKKNRVGTYPHQSVAKIPVPVNIRKMILTNTFVEYKEKNPRTNQAGRVQFNNTYATISNLTNDKNAIEKNNSMTVDISTRFLNKAPLRATWQFYLFNPKGRFDVKGNLGTINAKEVNILTRPMGPAQIDEGIIKNLQFNLAGDNYGMNGTVKMLYEDLKIAVLQKDEDSKKLKKKKLASFAANIIVKNANPAGNKDEARVIEVKNERDTNRSIFHLTWKTLFKGIKETVGIKK